MCPLSLMPGDFYYSIHNNFNDPENLVISHMMDAISSTHLYICRIAKIETYTGV